jgi:hypothetical protein
MFVSVKHIHHCDILGYFKGAPFGYVLALIGNIILGNISLPDTITLAYLCETSVTKKKNYYHVDIRRKYFEQ